MCYPVDTLDYPKSFLEYSLGGVKMFAPSIKTTTSVCNGALRGALANAGFEVVENGGFLEASDGKQALAILPVSRCLSSRNHTETTPIAASVAGVKKLMERYGIRNTSEILDQRNCDDLDVIVGNANVPGTLCIAFGVCKYSYADIELIVVPLKVFFQQAAVGSVFSIGSRSGDFFYEYAKATTANTHGVILRTHFIEVPFERGESI